MRTPRAGNLARCRVSAPRSVLAPGFCSPLGFCVRCFAGVKDALGMDEGTLKRAGFTAPKPPAKQAISMALFPAHDATAQRDLAIHLCGWVGLGETGALQANLRRVEGQGDHDRAAAIALFHHDMEGAIEALRNGAAAGGPGADTLLSAAMSLAGFNPEGNNQLWLETCGQLRKQLTSPYLRAAFGFLVAQGRDFDAVLKEPGLRLTDRVAFAVRFLSDDALLA